MNKSELIDLIANQNNCSKTEAKKAVNLFTHGIIGAVSQGNEISLVGFGNFTISAVETRKWQCIDCRTEHDRDINAAINIKQQGLMLLKAEGLSVSAN